MEFLDELSNYQQLMEGPASPCCVCVSSAAAPSMTSFFLSYATGGISYISSNNMADAGNCESKAKLVPLNIT